MWVLPVVCAINKEHNEVLGWRRGRADIHEVVVRCAAASDVEATAEAAKALAEFFGVPLESVVCIKGQDARHKEFALPIDYETLNRLLP